MDNNEKVEVEVRGHIAGMSLEEIGQRIVESMRMMDVLGALSDGYHDKFGSSEKAPEDADETWKAIHDLMTHFDEAVLSLGQEPIETNQLTLIRQLLALNLIDHQEREALREKFNDRVRDAVGLSLGEQCLQDLFELFHEFDIGAELAEMRGIEKKDLRPFKR